MRPRSLAAALLSCAVAGSLALGVTPVAGADDGRDRPAGERIPFQTSDRVPGEIAPPRVLARVVAPRVYNQTSRAMAQGVRYRAWTQQDDPARDPYRVHLVEASLSTAGVRLDLLSDPNSIRQRRTVPWLMNRERGVVAGVNGDFFDIRDTGAPLGNSRDLERNLLGARQYIWTTSFWIDGSGVPQIGEQRLVASIPQRPAWQIAHFNSPTVFPDQIGVYTPDWGTTLGARVTDGRTRRVREVVVRGGIVRSNRTRLSKGVDITGRVFIGRGRGADRLSRLKVGSRVGLRWKLSNGPVRMAVSGSDQLLRGGALTVSDDGALHPRTAIGIDRDTNRVLLVAVDGRSESSAGTTMVGLARLLRQQGAEDAINLDGGGSTTMVERRTTGETRVLNAPSDGRPRPVPNGLAVFAPPLS